MPRSTALARPLSHSANALRRRLLPQQQSTLTRARACASRYADGLAEHKTLGKRGIWFATTLLCVAFGALVAYTLPFFSIVMAVIASLGDIMSMVSFVHGRDALRLPAARACSRMLRWC